MTHTDPQLKQALAKMLPEAVGTVNTPTHSTLVWISIQGKARIWREPVLDTELLHLCWLVEENLNEVERGQYSTLLAQRDEKTFVWDFDVIHASWQQRTIALAKVKEVEVV